MTEATVERKTPAKLTASLDAADRNSAVYVTRYPLTSAAISLDSLKSIRGVVCAYIEKGDHAPLLCVFWRSRDEFQRDESSLLAHVPTEKDDSRNGFMSSFVSRRRWSAGEIVTFCLAVLGVWQTLSLLIHHVYQPGEVLVTAGRAGAINYFPEQQLIESFRITSRLPIDQRILVKEVVLTRDDKKVGDVIFAPRVVNGLGTDQSETIQISVPLPEKPGNYEIVATAQSKAGWLPRPKTQSYKMPVRIWSPVPRATFEGWSDVQTDIATARYRLEVGYAAPAGLDCTATVTGAPDIIAIIPRMAGAHSAGNLVTAGEQNLRVVSQSWTTRPFPDFANTTVPIVFHAATPVDWKRLPADRLQLDCSPNMESSTNV